MRRALILLLLLCSAQLAAAAEIQQIWLSHKSNEPDKMVINWLSEHPGDSVVHFGRTPDCEEQVRIEGQTTLHHVEIPLRERDVHYHYRVATGDQQSTTGAFKAYPTDVLRVAVVADWQGRPDLTALRRDNPHLLLTAGDNIDNVWPRCGVEGKRDCVQAYADLVADYPDLFRSTPFMPALGNHDRQIRPRGSAPPSEPVYDLEATAFRKFFELPDDEWKWRFDIPEFDLRLMALDFHHISDFGTTWQSCQPFDENSEQFLWYRKWMAEPRRFVVTIYNERNASVRGQAGGQWRELFQRGTLCITGYGHYAERSELDGCVYYNTSLQGRGNRYPDPHSRFLAGEDNYTLLTVTRAGNLVVELKNLQGEVLDRREFPRHK